MAGKSPAGTSHDFEPSGYRTLETVERGRRARPHRLRLWRLRRAQTPGEARLCDRPADRTCLGPIPNHPLGPGRARGTRLIAVDSCSDERLAAGAPDWVGIEPPRVGSATSTDATVFRPPPPRAPG